MMKKQNKSGSSLLFLTELTAAILFFAISCAVCIQIIARAHNFSLSSGNLSNASTVCASAAELCSGADSLNEIRSLFEDIYGGSDAAFLEDADGSVTCCLYYDADGNITAENSDACSIIQKITISADEDMIYCHQEVTAAGDETAVYDLDTVHHIKRRAAS